MLAGLLLYLCFLAYCHFVVPLSPCPSFRTMSPYKDAIAALFDDDDDSMLGSPSNKLIYSLGDAGDEQHMRKFARVDEKLLAIGQLVDKNFAFVKRSNGAWQYSIVMEVGDPNTGSEPHIKFLLNLAGHTKQIPMKKWISHIQLVKYPEYNDKRREESTRSASCTDDDTSEMSSVAGTEFGLFGISEEVEPKRRPSARPSLRRHPSVKTRAFLSALSAINNKTSRG